MGFFKKIGGFFGRVWNGVKHGVRKVREFVRDKIMPTAHKLKPVASLVANTIAPGSGAIVDKVYNVADKLSGSGSGS